MFSCEFWEISFFYWTPPVATSENSFIVQKGFDLIIFGDSITKYAIPQETSKSKQNMSLKYSKSCAKVKELYDQLLEF